MIDPESARSLWFPIAAGTDLAARHVFHARLLGRELAVWRADDGHPNAWENRCLHRGVRLTIGINDGAELVCRYHGWRYANRTAECTYIPAHPADAPARTVCNTRYPLIERHGLLWCAEAPGPATSLPELPDELSLTMRAIPVAAPLAAVRTALIELGAVHDGKQLHGAIGEVLYLLQPVDASRTVIRGLLRPAADRSRDERTDRAATANATAYGAADEALLLEHDERLERLRRAIEADPARRHDPDDWPVVAPLVAASLATMPEPGAEGRAAPLRLRVGSMVRTADGSVLEIDLLPLDADAHLPGATPGAHIDLHLPNGLVRQYSLANAPGQTDRYRIGVLREPVSTGGSAWLFERLRTGDVLAASVPRNGFALRRDAVDTLLIAGGIGITALASMTMTLQRGGHAYRLCYLARSAEHFALMDRLAPLGDALECLSGLDAAASRAVIAERLGPYREAHHVYVCGPTGLIGCVRELAAELGWPDEAVHFEHFGNAAPLDTRGAFQVRLARSGLNLTVPDGQTLLQTLREHGVPVPSSCEQGACGTCRVAVLDGQPDHRDVYLNAAERKRGDCLMSCVSRASSAALTLDL